jgi:hypothetical protein
MSLLLILLLIAIVPIVVSTVIWTVISKMVLKRKITWISVIFVALTVYLVDLIYVLYGEVGGNYDVNILSFIPLYILAILAAGGVATFFSGWKYTRVVTVVTAIALTAFCGVFITPYIQQEFAEHTPFYSTDFQEYKPTTSLWKYSALSPELGVEQESSWYAKTLSFTFTDKQGTIDEYQQDPTEGPSCVGVEPTSDCRSVTTPNHITYIIEPGYYSNEDISWMVGQTYFYMDIRATLANSLSDNGLIFFIDSFVPTHYSSIPIQYSKRPNF